MARVFPPICWVVYWLFGRDHSAQSTWIKRNFPLSVSAWKSGTYLRKFSSHFCSYISSLSILSLYRQEGVFSRLDFNWILSLAFATNRYLHRLIQHGLHHRCQWNCLCFGILPIFQRCISLEYEILNRLHGCCTLLW